MKFIDVHDEDGIRTITLNRPGARNASHAGMRSEILTTLAPINDDPAIRAVVITGAGDKAFCAGNDLAETRGLNERTSGIWVADLRRHHDAFRNLDKPCVAALNGVAAGAGLQIALLCDLRIGHADTRIGQPEINVGLASVIGVQLMELPWGIAARRTLLCPGAW